MLFHGNQTRVLLRARDLLGTKPVRQAPCRCSHACYIILLGYTIECHPWLCVGLSISTATYGWTVYSVTVFFCGHNKINNVDCGCCQESGACLAICPSRKTETYQYVFCGRNNIEKSFRESADCWQFPVQSPVFSGDFSFIVRFATVVLVFADILNSVVSLWIFPFCSSTILRYCIITYLFFMMF